MDPKDTFPEPPDYAPKDNPYAAPDVNFYAAPKAAVVDPRNLDATTVREEHIAHEASLKSVGCLFLLGGVSMALWAVGTLITLATERGPQNDEAFFVIAAPVLLGVGACYLALGTGLRKLSPWVRVPAAILSALSILSFPCGTAVGAYTIYLLFSSKGTTVFSDDYKDVIEATPHVKPRTSVVAWVVLLVLLALIGFGFLAAMVG